MCVLSRFFVRIHAIIVLVFCVCCILHRAKCQGKTIINKPSRSHPIPQLPPAQCRYQPGVYLHPVRFDSAECSPVSIELTQNGRETKTNTANQEQLEGRCTPLCVYGVGVAICKCDKSRCPLLYYAVAFTITGYNCSHFSSRCAALEQWPQRRIVRHQHASVRRLHVAGHVRQ